MLVICCGVACIAWGFRTLFIAASLLITGQAILLQLTASFLRPVARLQRSSELVLSLAAHIEISHTSSLKKRSETPPLLCLLSTVHASARV